jgi:hypothetical protein
VLELDGLVAFVVFGLWLYCIYDVITTDESLVRNLPKMVWLLLVLFLFDLGALAWLLLGRPQRWQVGRATHAGPTAGSRSSTLSEPSSLADSSLDGLSPVVREREERARMRMWEAQLKRREEDLRRRELGLGEGPDHSPSEPSE